MSLLEKGGKALVSSWKVALWGFWRTREGDFSWMGRGACPVTNGKLKRGKDFFSGCNYTKVELLGAAVFNKWGD